MTAPPKTHPAALRQSGEARSEAQGTAAATQSLRESVLGRHFVAAHCGKEPTDGQWPPLHLSP